MRDASLKVLGADHPDTLLAMGNLAATYKHQGRWNEAEELELQLRDAHLILLGAEHPTTLGDYRAYHGDIIIKHSGGNPIGFEFETYTICEEQCFEVYIDDE